MRRSIVIGLLCGVGSFGLLTWLYPRPGPGSLLPVRGVDRFVRRQDAAVLPPTYPASRRPYLDARVAEVQGKLTLSQIADIVRKATGLRVDLEARAIEAAGIEPSRPIDLDLRDVTVRRLLAAALEEFGGAVTLDYRAGDDAITISTAEDLWKLQDIRIYDVGDILSAIAANSSTELVEMLRDVITAGSFLPHTGPDRIGIVGQRLVVRADDRTHERLIELLVRLRFALLPAGRADETAPTSLPAATTFVTQAFPRREYLARRVPDVRGTLTLDHLATLVREASGVNVVIDRQTLETTGLETTSTAQIDLRDVTVHQLLAAALSAFALDAPLGYEADDDLIRISTREAIDGRMAIRAYNIADLLAMSDLPGEDAITDLATLIAEVIDWDRHVDDGDRGSTRYFAGTLVIRQTKFKHRRIEELFASLRAAAAK